MNSKPQHHKGLQMHGRNKQVVQKKKSMPMAAEVVNYLPNGGNPSHGPSGRARLGSQKVDTERLLPAPGKPEAAAPELTGIEVHFYAPSMQSHNVSYSQTRNTQHRLPNPTQFIPTHGTEEKDTQNHVQDDRGEKRRLSQKEWKCSKK